MNRTLFSIAAALGFSIVAAPALLAQSALAFNVPFSFNAAGVQLPSGKYTVSNTGQQFSTLRGYGGSIMFIRTADLNSKPTSAHLTFYKYGDAYFLREVWQDNGAGTRIKVGEREREVMRTEQQARNTGTAVLLAATH